nr:type I restriction enzyme endonuclease domain-containing protein [Thiospirillum jenense]
MTAMQVIQELIALAKDIRAARQRGQEYGLSHTEIAFYDALAENNSALQALGDANLRVIACELLAELQNNMSVDWTQRESIRARLRVSIRRILRKYGYPPDLQNTAIKTVLEQAEAMF